MNTYVQLQNFSCAMCGCMCTPQIVGGFPLSVAADATTVEATLVCQRSGCEDEGQVCNITLPLIQVEPNA